MTMTWFELSKLEDGTRVRFTSSWDIFSENIIVPEGTLATIQENGLNDIWCCLLVLPDDPNVRDALKDWDGLIQMNPVNDGAAMHDASPLEIA